MSPIRREQSKEFDFNKLPEGIHSFRGLEGFVIVEVDKNGCQSWNLDNWFASLDPDENKYQRQNIIQDIKQRLDIDTGIIKPHKKKTKSSLFNELMDRLR